MTGPCRLVVPQERVPTDRQADSLDVGRSREHGRDAAQAGRRSDQSGGEGSAWGRGALQGELSCATVVCIVLCLVPCTMQVLH